MTDKISTFIFNQWKAEFKKKKKDKAHVTENFSELFQNLFSQNVPFEEAHLILQKAIVVHYPNDEVVKCVYKRISSDVKRSEKEFAQSWKDNIADAATMSFHDYYKIEDYSPPKPVVQATYGSMSREEYHKQRKYADSHPTIDIDSINFEPVELEDELLQQIADAGFKIEPGELK